jgi:hypothetical protein
VAKPLYPGRLSMHGEHSAAAGMASGMRVREEAARRQHVCMSACPVMNHCLSSLPTADN